MPFIKDGFDRGDQAAHFVDPKQRADHLRRMVQAGIDLADARARGQLEVRSWDEGYIDGGRFDQHRMIECILEIVDPANKPPGRLSQGIAHMEWALEDLPGVHDIVDYETRLNYVLPNYDDPIVCVYDLSRFVRRRFSSTASLLGPCRVRAPSGGRAARLNSPPAPPVPSASRRAGR